MRSRKLFATMTLVALLGSDFVLAASPALGQSSTQGNGYPMTPTLGGGDGAYGRYLPGPSTTAPYIGVPQQQPPQMLPQQQPQMIQRPSGPAGPNVCQPGGGTRPYQTVSIPRSRPAEPPFFQQQASQPATVTQVTVSQNAPGAPAQVTQQPGADVRTMIQSVPTLSGNVKLPVNVAPAWRTIASPGRAWLSAAWKSPPAGTAMNCPDGGVYVVSTEMKGSVGVVET